jgi:hypothetical protein
MFLIMVALIAQQSLRNMEMDILVGLGMCIPRSVPLSYSWVCVAFDLPEWEGVRKTNCDFIV